MNPTRFYKAFALELASLMAEIALQNVTLVINVINLPVLAHSPWAAAAIDNTITQTLLYFNDHPQYRSTLLLVHSPSSSSFSTTDDRADKYPTPPPSATAAPTQLWLPSSRLVLVPDSALRGHICESVYLLIRLSDCNDNKSTMVLQTALVMNISSFLVPCARLITHSRPRTSLKNHRRSGVLFP